jgi:energy-coupling factor transporter ATP-binding protein EcfA2
MIEEFYKNSPILRALPSESILHHHVKNCSIMEPPFSYDLLCAATVLGTSLKRDVWVNQVKWKVYPALATMLVGPSGCGKNTAIGNVKELAGHLQVPLVGGGTIETIVDQVFRTGDPASCIIVAEELADMVGKKDYQQGIVTGVTDLLDCKEFKDISLKSTGVRRIPHPTIGMLCGSTAHWLHTALPKDAQQGGFYGRFIVPVENGPKRHVGLIGNLPKAEQEAALEAGATFAAGAAGFKERWKGRGEIPFTRSAAKLYDEWYAQRHAQFGPLASDYANRSRDHALRLAMLSALTSWREQISDQDVAFALAFITHIAQNIEQVLSQTSKECEVGDLILPMLPATLADLYRALARGYSMRVVREAFAWLQESGQAKIVGTSMVPVEAPRGR